ncbi:gamma-aminobutyric acid receptor subunit beta-like isoform X2 [Uloborus diversus]|uniref:gamma-aminobutyric acid receptor subunit beta-like isoform X2 n=1 Tax=Uloborus diversus TaxID=327109 RepID=UPI002409F92D|nr:gamma-aminobutyric acid receptor subunit beta-like isoform X2 [Uloborus diversus]
MIFHLECHGYYRAQELENITELIKHILVDYDIRLRPNFGGDPIFIGMDLQIASFDAISEVNMDYTLTLYLNQYWQDTRLAFSTGTYELTLSGEFAAKIWVPDTFFANDKNSFLHDVTEQNKMVRLSSDGTIKYGMRFTTTLACMMDLHYYPLDSQNCTIEIESYGYTVADVKMYWMKDAVQGVEKADLPQFSILRVETTDRLEALASGTYQRLSLSFELKRNIGYFIFQTYLPCILIVMLSWVSFWINHEATSARVALGITTVLTMTTISTGVRSSLPRISYVKAIDIYLVMCFVFVFAALLEYAAVNYTYWGSTRAKKKAKKLKDSKAATEGGTNEEIIELQDVRVSPIPYLRRRNKTSTYSSETYFPPSFRRTRTPYYSQGFSRKSHERSIDRHKRPYVLSSLKRGASALKASLPRLTDINKIDKIARVVFPVSFLLFNSIYWCFYLV